MFENVADAFENIESFIARKPRVCNKLLPPRLARIGDLDKIGEQIERSGSKSTYCQRISICEQKFDRYIKLPNGSLAP